MGKIIQLILDSMNMRIGIIAHTTIDHIISNGVERQSIGGPTYYAGLTIKQFALDTKLITKIGYDFPLLEDGYGMIEKECIVNAPTTRFMLLLNGYSRRLLLLAKCKDITEDDIVDVDGYIVSPVINEISINTLNYIKNISSFTFLDPQGFVRRVRDRECYLASTQLDTNGIDVIKVDKEEAFALTGLHGIEALNALKSNTSILTDKASVIMLHRGRFYSVEFEPIKSIDSTGVGDIFAGAYTSSYMIDRDPIWALSSAIASSLEALASNALGLDKVPSFKAIEERAEEIYEKVIHS